MRVRLAVVHGPAGQEAEQLLLLVLGEVRVDVGGDQFALVRHQK